MSERPSPVQPSCEMNSIRRRSLGAQARAKQPPPGAPGQRRSRARISRNARTTAG